MDTYPGYNASGENVHGVGGADALRQKTIPELLALHDRAGFLQQQLLEQYPGGTDALPMPLRDDLRYFDGAQFFMLHISESMREAGFNSVLTDEQQLLLSSTNGLNDWWMDEYSQGREGGRDYNTVIETYVAIDTICSIHAAKNNPDNDTITKNDSEIEKVVNYYDYVLRQMPEEHRADIAKLLMSINLYQGYTLFQERGFREHQHMDEKFLGIMAFYEDDGGLKALHDMQVEKGGFMLMYFWPYLPEISDGIVNMYGSAQDRDLGLGWGAHNGSHDIRKIIDVFLQGKSLYKENHIGRQLLQVGGVLQMMDDMIDRELDFKHGVVSPENMFDLWHFWPTYAARANETWEELVENVLDKLSGLREQDDDSRYKTAVDAATSAVAGLTRYRAYVYGSTST